MALYLGGNEKFNLIINGVVCKPCVGISKPVTDLIKLLSKDNLILTDSNGIYLTAKESE